MTALGVVFRPQLPPERLRSVALAADAAGLDELWLWEDCFAEGGLTAAAAALAWTSRISVGIGLLPVPLRNVALTAMEVATVSRMFPGRLQVGVGHGVQEWMGQVGARVASPLTLLREYTTALRSLLAGDEVTVSGRYVTLDAVRLAWPPEVVPPILIGAVGAKTLALSAELADGTIATSGMPPSFVRSLRDGAGASHRLVAYLIGATGPGTSERLARELASWSLDPTADVVVSGSAEQLADGIGRWVEAGADSVIIQPTADEPDLEAFAHFLGTEVRPRL